MTDPNQILGQLADALRRGDVAAGNQMGAAAIALLPGHGDAAILATMAALAADDPDQAAIRALAAGACPGLDGTQAGALHDLWLEIAGRLIAKGRAGHGAESADRALGFRQSAAAHVLRAQALFALGQFGDALAAAQNARQMQPSETAAVLVAGNSLIELGRAAEAAELFQHLPGADGIIARADALFAASKHKDAAALLDQLPAGLTADQGARAGLVRLKLAAEAGDEPGALAALAIARRGGPETQRLAGDLAFHPLGRPDLAREILTPLVTAGPQADAARYGLSFADLAEGRIAQGWAGYKLRHMVDARHIAGPNLALPVWRGEAIASGRLYVWREQGLGDELLFATCYPDLIARLGPDKLVIECDPRLLALFTRSFVGVEFRGVAVNRQSPPDVPADCVAQIAAGDLCALFRPGIQDFPQSPARLTGATPPALAAKSGAKRIGFLWRGLRDDPGRRSAYSPLTAWASLITASPFQWISLQYDAAGSALAEIGSAGLSQHLFEPAINLKDDLDQVAGLSAQLDLVIATDSAGAQLAALAGAPVWRLMTAKPWTQLGTDGYPWFARQRCFRKALAEPWDSVVARVGAALETADWG